jgi:cbb3-type cytochrome oxidase subunit 3
MLDINSYYNFISLLMLILFVVVLILILIYEYETLRRTKG